LLADPNYKCSQADYEAQVSFLVQVQEKFNETMKAIRKIKNTRQQITEYTARLGKTCPAALKNLGDSLAKRLTAVEELLHQTKAKSGQDVLNYPIRLDDKLSGVFDMANSGNMAPPQQARDVFSALATQVDAALAQLQNVLGEGLQSFNKMIVEQRLPVIVAEQ
jgi:predicted component of type VI protein secretion system